MKKPGKTIDQLGSHGGTEYRQVTDKGDGYSKGGSGNGGGGKGFGLMNNGRGGKEYVQVTDKGDGYCK